MIQFHLASQPAHLLDEDTTGKRYRKGHIPNHAPTQNREYQGGVEPTAVGSSGGLPTFISQQVGINLQDDPMTRPAQNGDCQPPAINGFTRLRDWGLAISF
jgi:hypothetical protein